MWGGVYQSRSVCGVGCISPLGFMYIVIKVDTRELNDWNQHRFSI